MHAKPARASTVGNVRSSARRKFGHPGGPGETASGPISSAPSPREVLGEAGLTVAVFLLIALALQMLGVWLGG